MTHPHPSRLMGHILDAAYRTGVVPLFLSLQCVIPLWGVKSKNIKGLRRRFYPEVIQCRV